MPVRTPRARQCASPCAGIGLAASLQLMAVLPTHTPTALAPLGLVFEFDRTEHPIRQAILRLGPAVSVLGPGASL
jgi:hypothetical protein